MRKMRPADVDRAHFPDDAFALSQRLEPLEAYERELKEQRFATRTGKESMATTESTSANEFP